MKVTTEIDFHQRRRAFIIMPEVGIIWAEQGSAMSHTEILAAWGISKDKRAKIIKNCPRGYFLDNTLVIYQGDCVKEGACWTLSEKNYQYVRAVYNDMIKILSINRETKIFLSVRCGRPGDVWEQLQPVSFDFFK